MTQLITRITEWFWARIERTWKRKTSTINKAYDATAVTRWAWCPPRWLAGRLGLQLTCIWEVDALVIVGRRTFRFYDKTPFVYLYGYLENAYFDRMNREFYDDPFAGHDPFYGHE